MVFQDSFFLVKRQKAVQLSWLKACWEPWLIAIIFVNSSHLLMQVSTGFLNKTLRKCSKNTTTILRWLFGFSTVISNPNPHRSHITTMKPKGSTANIQVSDTLGHPQMFFALNGQTWLHCCWLVLSPQREGSCFESQLQLFCVAFTYYPHDCVGCLLVLWVNMNMHVCFPNWCLSGPMMDWWPAQGISLPLTLWQLEWAPSDPCDPEQHEANIENRLMVG